MPSVHGIAVGIAQANQATVKMRIKKLTSAIIILSFVLTLVSCASPGIRGKAPFVQLNGLHVDNDLITVDLGVRNVNTEAILLQQIEFSISLDQTTLAIYKAPSQAGISANGTENFRFELSPSPEGLALLDDLQNGNRPNLVYSLEGMLVVQEEDELPILGKGRIFPVPGRPGHFR